MGKMIAFKNKQAAYFRSKIYNYHSDSWRIHPIRAHAMFNILLDTGGYYSAKL